MTVTNKPRVTWAGHRGAARLPRLGVGLLAAAGLFGFALSSMGAVSAHVQTIHATTSTAGSSYVAVTPFRVADTRPGSGQPDAGKTLGAGQTLNVQVTGLGTVPAGATAAVLNVTAVNPTAAGFLTVFPEGTTMPTVSNLNFNIGQTVANLVTVGLSASGMASVYNSAGSTNVVIDVDGYYVSSTSSTGSGLFNPLSPTRVLGSLASGQSIGANTATAVTVAGAAAADGVPASATAVVVNVTAAMATAPSYITVYPAGVARPLASNLNFGAQVPNQAIANRVTVKVGTNGQIDVYNYTGTVNVDVDVNGYYSGSGGTGSVFVPVQPVRLTDTRVGMNGTPLAPSSTETFNLTSSAIPSSATSVAANFTVVPGDAPGYLTVYPTSDSAAPVASDVNWTASEFPAVPNFTIADTAATGSVAAFNSHGATINLVIDAFGYFAPAVTPAVVVTTTTSGASTTINEGASIGLTATITVPSADYPDEVQWTASGPGCAATPLSPTTGSATSATPAVTTTLTASSTTSGTCVVTATESATGQSGSITITVTPAPNTVTFLAPTFSNHLYTVTAGSSPFEIETHVANASGTAVPNDSVTIAGTGTPSAACGSFSATTQTTNSSGDAFFFYTPSSTVGFCDITATEAATGGSVTGTVSQDNATPPTALAVAVTTNKTIIQANGTSTSTVTVTTTNGGVIYPNDPVEVGTTGSACGTLAGADSNGNAFAVTGTSGTATVTYTSSSTSGVCQVLAIEGQNDTAAPGISATLSLALSTSTAPTSLSVTDVVGSTANVTTGQTVDLLGTNTSGQAADTQQFVTGGASTTTSINLTGNTTLPNAAYAIGTYVVVNGGAVIEQAAAPTPTNTITVSPSSNTSPKGSDTFYPITVTVTNASGPVSGDSVSYSVTGSPSTACGTISPASPESTGTNGVAPFEYYSNASTTGFCTVTFTEAGTGQSATLSIDTTA